jgi:hypothetical protein
MSRNLSYQDPVTLAAVLEQGLLYCVYARKLAELLRGNLLSPIYHGENGVRTLKELARSYLTIT